MEKCFRIIWMVLPLFVALFSCANDMGIVKKIIDAETEPDLVAENVILFHSDSARLQTKLVAPLVKIFNTEKKQRREFPEGAHVWMYEKTSELKAEITADWAIHDMEINLWEARGNVVITNAEGRKLETEQLFWNPTKEKDSVYSEKYTKTTDINGTVAIGISGFTANQDFTEFRLFSGRATIIMKDKEPEPEDKP